MSQFAFIINSSIALLRGVGNKSVALLEEICGGKRFADILLHIPDNIICRDFIRKSKDLNDGQEIVAKVKVISKSVKSKFSSVSCEMESGFVNLIFFDKGLNSFAKLLTIGSSIWIAGKVSFRAGYYSVVHPKICICDISSEKPPIEFLYSPRYSRLGLKFSDKRFSSFVWQILSKIRADKKFFDWNFRKKEFGWPDFFESINILHFPSSERCLKMRSKCIERLAYDELLIQRIFFLRHSNINNLKKGMICSSKKILQEKIINSIGFKLTKDQVSSLSDIENDQFSSRRMFRILYGDVGSGKTLVAVLSSLNAIESGFQVAFLAPTEVLAVQHYKNIKLLLSSLDLKIDCFLGSTNACNRKDIKESLISGKIHFIIGTHTLFQESVDYLKLGMIIVDEQQRFGVSQRRDMFCKNSEADVLMISATPIPRTMQMIYSGFASCSTIQSAPSTRGQIQTFVVNENKMIQSLEKLSKSEFGKKIIWICPSIENSEGVKMASIEHRLSTLKNHFNVGVIHGRVSKADKEEIIDKFISGEINLLLSTTVVEVGLDVKDVTCMVIDNANRFGLSQLHQCRGRVARGISMGYCFLLYDSIDISKKGIKRLKIMCENSDGFSIAEHDFKLRGSGELFGDAQSGFFGYRFFCKNNSNHEHIAEVACKDANILAEKDNLDFDGLSNLISLFGYNELNTFV